VVAYFVVLGVANGVWLARIPAVKQELRLSDGALGLALLAAPAGLVVAAPIASRLAHRVGSHRLTLVAGLLVILGLLALGLASSRAALMAALFGFGLSSGLLDVGMNSQAVLVERAAGRPLMTSFHACFSVGGLAGALLGGAFAWAGAGLLVNFITASIPLACGAALAGRWLLPDQNGNGAAPAHVPPPADRAPPDPGRAHRLEPVPGAPVPTAPGPLAPLPAARSFIVPPLLLMALLATCALLGEGAADGWSAVYLRDDLGAPAGLAALAYAGFCIAMAVGRLSGDRLAARFGPVTVLRWSGLTAAAGLTCAIAAGHAVGAIAGFAIFGAGLSCTFPLLLSAAGHADPARPARGIATVAGLGYVGMLAGPVAIGGLASAFGLTTALIMPVVLALAICAGAGLARPRRDPAARPPGLAREGMLRGLSRLQGSDGAHEQVQAEFEVGVVVAAAQLRSQVRHLRELRGPQTETTHVADAVGRCPCDPGLR
jgi:MFS family permease